MIDAQAVLAMTSVHAGDWTPYEKDEKYRVGDTLLTKS